MKRSDRKAWRKKYDHVVATLKSLRDHIDDLGQLGDLLYDDSRDVDAREPDTIACFASNSIEGTLALLRDLEDRVLGSVEVRGEGARKARKRARRAR